MHLRDLCQLFFNAFLWLSCRAPQKTSAPRCSLGREGGVERSAWRCPSDVDGLQWYVVAADISAPVEAAMASFHRSFAALKGTIAHLCEHTSTQYFTLPPPVTAAPPLSSVTTERRTTAEEGAGPARLQKTQPRQGRPRSLSVLPRPK